MASCCNDVVTNQEHDPSPLSVPVSPEDLETINSESRMSSLRCVSVTARMSVFLSDMIAWRCLSLFATLLAYNDMPELGVA